jgi:hypothetical protein
MGRVSSHFFFLRRQVRQPFLERVCFSWLLSGEKNLQCLQAPTFTFGAFAIAESGFNTFERKSPVEVVSLNCFLVLEALGAMRKFWLIRALDAHSSDESASMIV